MRAMTRQEYGHLAAFAYAPKYKTRMRELKQPVLLVPFDDGLAKETAAAATDFPQAQVSAKVYPANVLSSGAADLGQTFRDFLDH